jgi:protein involved in polysaccharide export with SLBB domain
MGTNASATRRTPKTAKAKPISTFLTIVALTSCLSLLNPAGRAFLAQDSDSADGAVSETIKANTAGIVPTQGEYALRLAVKLGLGEQMTQQEAVSTLTELGIKPTGGWQPNRQVDDKFLADIRNSAKEATKSGTISTRQADEILRYRPAQQFEQPQVDVTRTPGETVGMQQGLSTIERLLSGEIAGDVSKTLTQFGYGVFQAPVSTFAPVTNVPVGPDYVVGPGDSFTVTLWGRVNAQYNVAVDRSGQITLPEVGVLKVWGMTFDRLQNYLEHEFSRKYTDFKMAVTMDRLRTIRVYVVGEAQTPGGYSLSSLSTVINALFAAGGPSKNGTMRNVRMLRNSTQSVTIDLYDFLLGGDKSKDARLQDGDTIFIPLIGPVVGVAGNVKRPAIYEMSKPMSLAEVLQLAGGITYAGWLQRVQVERVDKHEKRIVADFDISEKADIKKEETASAIQVQDGDVVKVFAVSPLEQNVVYLQGHVVRPGKYELKPDMRLRDVLSSYNVLQPQPNLEYAEIERLIEPDFHPVVIPFKLDKLLEGDDSENIELARFDTIRVFRWDERLSRQISVSGLVYRAGQYRLIPDMRVSNLVDAAGGLAKNAYLRTAEITRRHISQDGMTTEKIDIDLAKALAGEPGHNIRLQDYDHLVVRPIPELEFDRTATISGEVRFPGTYPVRRGETLSSVIERAGGYTERAYLKGALFTRESAKAVQQRRMDELTQEIEETILVDTDRAMGGAVDEETIKTYELQLKAKRELLGKLRAARIDGRVVIRLASLEQFKASKYDLELEKGDSLAVPETPGVVNVVGEVFNPTALLYEEARTVDYYLRKVGGMTEEANKKQISVIRADGSVVSIAQKNAGRIDWDSSSNQWVFGGFMSIKLDPGDTIMVPRKMDKFFWLRTAKDITQILFNAALATGVVLAL